MEPIIVQTFIGHIYQTLFASFLVEFSHISLFFSFIHKRVSRSGCANYISLLGFETRSYLIPSTTMVTEECLKKGMGGNKLTDLIIKHWFIYEKSN